VADGAELARASEGQHAWLFQAQLDAETASARLRVRVGADRRRSHDAANALTAVEGAAMILQQETETLDGADRTALEQVLMSGIHSLRRLLVEDEEGEGLISLCDALATAGEKGKVDTDEAQDLTAQGAPGQIEEALRQLLRHASSVRASGGRDGAEVVLRIEGCDLPMSIHQGRVLVDEHDRLPGWDNAIGVFVAARLVREQGGSVWVESRSGTPPSYAIHLPKPEKGGTPA
jgi:light-regulated signal transduction histidine kinase (bacteriophytochrome)